MCKTTSLSTTAAAWLYLDTTGAPTFETVSCSCELIFDFTTALNTKYRAQEETSCGLRFQLNDEDWECENEDLHVIQVQSLSNITFFKTIQSQRTAYACMGLKPGKAKSQFTDVFIKPSTGNKHEIHNRVFFLISS